MPGPLCLGYADYTPSGRKLQAHRINSPQRLAKTARRHGSCGALVTEAHAQQESPFKGSLVEVPRELNCSGRVAIYADGFSSHLLWIIKSVTMGMSKY